MDNCYGLEGRTILITGSSRGIGAATAHMARTYGARVVLHGKTESKRLINLAEEIGSQYIFCDVADEISVKRGVEKVGRVDILINNAGINLSKPYMEQTGRDWRKTLETNVLGVVNFSKAVMPQMQKRKFGKIINMSSVKGYEYFPGSWAYAGSKALIIDLTSNMARDLAPYGILVNAVAPGFTETDMTTATLTDRTRKQLEQVPLGRMARAEEIAEMILFLASDKNTYMTGQTLKVSGGL